MNNLPVTGGTIDATAIAGPTRQICTSSFTLKKFDVLKLAAGTIISGSCAIAMDAESAIEGDGATGSYADGSESSVQWFYTATSGNFISIADNAYQVRLANVRFIGPAPLPFKGTGSGHGLYVSSSTGKSNVGLNLDHVTFQRFWGDGIHLEENVYFVDCYSCAAEQNGGYGWYQAQHITAVAPSQVNLYSIKLNSNGLNGSGAGQLYAGGGSSAGELRIFGGSIANDLPVKGGGASCLVFVADHTQQMNTWIAGLHVESCGQTAGGQFIDWNVSNGVLSVHDTYFVNPNEIVAYPITLGPSFNGYAYIGPGNFFSNPANPVTVHNANTSTTGVVALYDPAANIDGRTPSHLSLPIQVGQKNNKVYRCTAAGRLPVGALTISSADCGASIDTLLRAK